MSENAEITILCELHIPQYIYISNHINKMYVDLVFDILYWVLMPA